jgi:hypothetical protein
MILHVEDDEARAEMVRRCLEDDCVAHQIVHALDGEVALVADFFLMPLVMTFKPFGPEAVE